ncbi:PrpR N-terminal domain-containing protein [Paenibacillus allorhizosphaerae]|uniref:Anaerobic nitric oxide reductase transcription regulator NorR n=1 Tax=Paenibacillus allorhizosphaerae TaxID=2849866 RepID=A0ABN7TK97_9BACL|nr:sigma-54-dependent Fis family transcriptional regulator [Paenibacillus allorhizosphaerae]CAG7643123.1 Anaerobic nitric oxide reductase transcription regulator NorR [Paenibacillus allorhizosphaerae]
MKIRVLAIAPYPGLKDLLVDMAGDDGSIDMDVETADLQEAIPLAQQAERKGYDIIVSRGGTATLIRKHTALPVVDIPVSGYDILRVLTLIKNANSKVAIIGFPNVCHGGAAVSSLLDIDIPAYVVDHESQVEGALREAFRSGVKIVLGDVVTVRTAQEMGYHGILITSGRESVTEALDLVRRVYEVYRRGREQMRFYEQIMAADSRGIVVLDETRTIRYANQAACRPLGTKEDQLQGSSLILSSPSLAGLIKQAEEAMQTEMEQYVHMQERQFRVNAIRHRVDGKQGWLVRLEAVEQWRIDQLNPVRIPPRVVSFDQLIGSSSALQKTVSRAKKFAASDRSIWISGEKGSGKSMFAQAVHSASKRRDQGFYMIACDEMTDEQTEMLLSGTAHAPGLFEGGFGGTLYLKNADRLTRFAQTKWLHALRRSNNVRLVASSLVPLTKLQHRTEYSVELLTMIAELQLNVPPLRERPEDLEEIVRVMIADYNSESGKQIVGIRDRVLERLVQYEWPGNIAELENTIQEMLITTRGHYIESGDAAEVLERLERPDGSRVQAESYVQIDLSGTFEEIEARILWHVLQEEGLNQSKACKRLGINRTTLWRKANKLFKNET